MALPIGSRGLPDAANPRAVAYAHQQLQRMVRMGLMPKMPSGLPGEDVTATYRRLSGALGARNRVGGLAGDDVGGALSGFNPGGPMQGGGSGDVRQILQDIAERQAQPAAPPAATNPLDAAAEAQAAGSIPQPPAAVGSMQGAAQAQAAGSVQQPAAVGPMVRAAMPRSSGQHPSHAALQALMAAVRPQVHGPVNPRQQIIAHLAQRIRAASGPHIQNFGGGGY